MVEVKILSKSVSVNFMRTLDDSQRLTATKSNQEKGHWNKVQFLCVFEFIIARILLAPGTAVIWMMTDVRVGPGSRQSTVDFIIPKELCFLLLEVSVRDFHKQLPSVSPNSELYQDGVFLKNTFLKNSKSQMDEILPPGAKRGKQ